MAVILLAESDPFLSEDIARFLKSLQHTVTETRYLDQAKRLAGKEKFDLLICSTRLMSQQNQLKECCVELISSIRGQSPDVPVIICSGGAGAVQQDIKGLSEKKPGYYDNIEFAIKPLKLMEQLDLLVASALLSRSRSVKGAAPKFLAPFQ